MSYEPPTPPAELPTAIVDTLNRHSLDQLQHVARYAEELAEHKAREACLEEETGEDDIKELETGVIFTPMTRECPTQRLHFDDGEGKDSVPHKASQLA